tara:strand:+ start:928 stop:1083 length:156 start_codon:yes stop_codon:yes gene_type:complete
MIGPRFENTPQPFAKNGFVDLKNKSCAQGKGSHYFPATAGLMKFIESQIPD